MISPQAEAVRKRLVGAERTGLSPRELRAASSGWDEFMADPGGVEREAVRAGGVPAEWTRPQASVEDRALLFLHGGGYALGSAATHRPLVAHLVRAIGCPALSLDYRLAPEDPFPAAVEDACAGYRWLLGEGFDPGRVLLAGDSSGGGLALAALLALRDAGQPLPAGAVTMSAWTDLAMTGDSLRTRAAADIVSSEAPSRERAEWYLGGADPQDPLASPLYGDLAGLPPLLLQVGDEEILLDDSVRFAERGTAAGVDVTLEVVPEMHHVFQISAGLMPESDAAVGRIGAWGRARLGLEAPA